jgi:hypothetical protein
MKDPLKVEKDYMRFRKVHSRTFYDIDASLGKEQEMRAFRNTILPSLSAL